MDFASPSASVSGGGLGYFLLAWVLYIKIFAMVMYIIKRFSFVPLTVFGVMLVTFLLFDVIGSDVTSEYVSDFTDAKTRGEIREHMGLDKPLLFSLDSRFVKHIRDAVTFDFGRAYDGQRISEKIFSTVGYSLGLTVPILFGTVFVSVVLALLSLRVLGRGWNYFIAGVCAVGMSVPFLGYIVLGQYLFAYKLGWSPVYFGHGGSVCGYYVLPVFIGILAGLGGNVRFYRGQGLSEIQSGYVKTAKAFGVGANRILFVHVLRNMLAVILTRVLLSIPYLFLGSILLERFFGIPGIGSLTLSAVAGRDYRILNAVVYMTALIAAFCTVLIDVLYCVVDPRVRCES